MVLDVLLEVLGLLVGGLDGELALDLLHALVREVLVLLGDAPEVVLSLSGDVCVLPAELVLETFQRERVVNVGFEVCMLQPADTFVLDRGDLCCFEQVVSGLEVFRVVLL